MNAVKCKTCSSFVLKYKSKHEGECHGGVPVPNEITGAGVHPTVSAESWCFQHSTLAAERFAEQYELMRSAVAAALKATIPSPAPEAPAAPAVKKSRKATA